MLELNQRLEYWRQKPASERDEDLWAARWNAQYADPATQETEAGFFEIADRARTLAIKLTDVELREQLEIQTSFGTTDSEAQKAEIAIDLALRLKETGELNG